MQVISEAPRVVRTKRMSSSKRAAARRSYRRRKFRVKRALKRRKRTSAYKRRKKLIKRLKKRIKTGGRRRLRLSLERVLGPFLYESLIVSRVLAEVSLDGRFLGKVSKKHGAWGVRALAGPAGLLNKWFLMKDNDPIKAKPLIHDFVFFDTNENDEAINVEKVNERGAEMSAESKKSMVESKDYSKEFELSQDQLEAIKKMKLEDQIELVKEPSDDEDGVAKLKPEVAKDLARTFKVFTDGKAADEYEKDATESVKSFVEEEIEKIVGADKAKDFKVDVKVSGEDAYTGSDAMAAYITIEHEGEEKEIEHASLYYQSGDLISQAMPDNGGWDWA
ncbi:MAG: hypothetical protein IPN68_18275, partial [Bacteroidetes bacterium]|nr:hypothetical protein [Bacteroidota bacterium]